MSQRLFIVSNRLPVTVHQHGDAYDQRPSSGGLVSAVNAWLQGDRSTDFTTTFWAGAPDCTPEAWQAAASPDSGYTYLPVFLEAPCYDAYYNGFSNSLLWPLFHYFPSFSDYTPAHFDAYLQANRAFADTLLQELTADDVVWIHDYHLLPLAGMLRDVLPSLTIGFFLHIPFPSYELFRVMPKDWQRALLTGMLGADLIGFHTVEYATHFLHSLELVLKLEPEGRHITWGGRRVKVDAFPISIDFDRFHTATEQPGVAAAAASYRALKGSRKLIFSVDRLDYTKGISNRLRGYERFLTDHPAYAGKVVFALNIVPSRDAITRYAERKKLIDGIIGNLNSRLGTLTWQPVIYQYNHLSFEELAGLYAACDLALITPLRDGMNLVAKEFAATRNDGRGVLVLSEMAGAAAELTEALLINPNDVGEVAAMIRRGLEMPENEQQERMAAMQDRIRHYDVVAWAADFFAQLQQTKQVQSTAGLLVLDASATDALLRRYAAADRRLLLLDYDGTLVPFSKRPEHATPGAALLDLLGRLSSHPKNDVYIISGRDSQTLETWLGHLPVGLVAEHGAMVRDRDAGWQVAASNAAVDWKTPVLRLMDRYASRCAHSFVEQKTFSVAWHYRNAELPDGAVRADQLCRDLNDLTAAFPLQVLQGNKVIEVRPRGINKGLAADQVLQQHDCGFVLAIGDDKTDEDMFRQLAPLPQAVTVKIGDGPSRAIYGLRTQAQAVALLEHFASCNDATESLPR